MESKKPLFSEYCCYVLGILAMCAQGLHIANRHLRDIGMNINVLIERQPFIIDAHVRNHL
jgi:hypothetical protein